ncbi:DUF2177 family protein [Candidatus Dojkabacteria bacterium]|uniref:DUF2177 family protein n=1 Tax=Candidatus Dojkabacteria bacterium TaxID=2099670 RepID=A0A955L8Z3_9BACT|nr:DUF2177 family protein [Candidatus Dojkabacteria bacterium]
MKITIVQYILALVVFLICDGIWLGVVAKDLYAKYLGHLMTEQVIWTSAIIFYLLFTAGLVVFVIQPHINATYLTLGLYAAFFGLVTYATYDLTNLATLKDWPWQIVFIDIIWGMSIAVITAVLTKYLMPLIS